MEFKVKRFFSTICVWNMEVFAISLWSLFTVDMKIIVEKTISSSTPDFSDTCYHSPTSLSDYPIENWSQSLRQRISRHGSGKVAEKVSICRYFSLRSEILIPSRFPVWKRLLNGGTSERLICRVHNLGKNARAEYEMEMFEARCSSPQQFRPQMSWVICYDLKPSLCSSRISNHYISFETTRKTQKSRFSGEREGDFFHVPCLFFFQMSE